MERLPRLPVANEMGRVGRQVILIVHCLTPDRHVLDCRLCAVRCAYVCCVCANVCDYRMICMVMVIVVIMVKRRNCGGLCDFIIETAAPSHGRATSQAYRSFLLVANKRDATVQCLANVLNRYAAGTKRTLR